MRALGKLEVREDLKCKLKRYRGKVGSGERGSGKG